MRTATMVLAATLTSLPLAAQQAPTAEQIDSIFAQYNRSDGPGCALGVIHDGNWEYKRGYGIANLDYRIPISSYSVFRTASVSKQFTAAAVVLLDEAGRLSLDDDIHKYLPELPTWQAPVTIRELLHHTSGIRDYLDLMDLAGLRDDDYYTDADVMAMLARQRALNFAPGTAFTYSNSGYFLLSQIVRKVTGMSLRAFADSAIFEPLGMDHTHFHDDHTEVVPHRAVGYAPREGGGWAVSTTNLDMVGDGGLFTSVNDLLEWDRNFAHPRIGHHLPETLLQRVRLQDGDTLDYALGLVRGAYRGVPTVSHGGAFVGYRTFMVRFPRQGYGVIVLCNVSTADPGALAYQVADRYLGKALGPAPRAMPDSAQLAAVDTAAYDRLVGRYRIRHGPVLVVSRTGRHLYLHVNRASGELVPVRGRSTFRIGAGADTVAFIQSGDKLASGVTHTTLGVSTSGGRIPDAPRLTPAGLAAFVGDYTSAALGVTYHLAMADDSLTVAYGHLPRTTLVAEEPDVFRMTGRDLTLRFTHAPDGTITGFTADAPRAWGITFERREPAMPVPAARTPSPAK